MTYAPHDTLTPAEFKRAAAFEAIYRWRRRSMRVRKSIVHRLAQRDRAIKRDTAAFIRIGGRLPDRAVVMWGAA